MNNRMFINNEMVLFHLALLTQIIILIPSIIIITLFFNSNDHISLISYPLSYPGFLGAIYLGSLGLGSIMSFFLVIFSTPFITYYKDNERIIIFIIGLIGMALCSSMVLYGVIIA